MSEMVERLAEVIYKKAVEHDYDPNHCIPEARKVYRDIARAAILAMREPTEAMWMATEPALTRSTGYIDREDFIAAYQAMIDQALSGDKP